MSAQAHATRNLICFIDKVMVTTYEADDDGEAGQDKTALKEQEMTVDKGI